MTSQDRSTALPLFHLYGDPPDDQAFDFIHIERGGGEMTFDVSKLAFEAPAAILVPAAIAHGFRFEPNATDGWVISFTEDAAGAIADRSGEAVARLRALAAEPVVPLDNETVRGRLSALAA